MSPTTVRNLKLSFICVAVLSVSGCASTPRLEEVPGAIGSGLSKAGHKTIELSASAWEGTKKLLHIGPQEDELLDEVDLALMDYEVDENGIQIQAVEPVAQLEAEPLEGTEVLLPGSDNGNDLVFNDADPLTDTVPGAEGTTVLQDNQLVVDANPVDVLPAIKDLEHEVQSNETLWQIAKDTTGDANNWHVIADINNLAPDASVQPGQKIMIPADMLKAEIFEANAIAATSEEAKPLITESEEATATVVAQVEQSETEVKRLAIPTATASEDLTVAAATPAAKPAITESTETAVAIADIDANATMFKVGAGETLWDFAKRTTGDATNWKSIAEQNQFSEQQATRVRPGQEIFVPSDMVKERSDNQLAQSDATNTNALDASAAVLAGNNTPEAAEQDIKIVEAAFQSDNELKPLSAEDLSAQAGDALDAGSDELGRVMVSGTYYPKAIYNEADFASSLLMRVSPGTELKVSKAVGPWLEVQTDKGVGYVHSRDIK